MKPDLRNLDEVVIRYLPSASKQEVESDGARVLQRLRSMPDHLEHAGIDDLANVESVSVLGWRRIGMVSAAAVVLLALFAASSLLWPRGEAFARVESVDGALYRVAERTSHAIPAGEVLTSGETVRTNGGAGATLTLADGSRVEMRSQSELSLERADDGVRIRLSEGGVIVNAAKQLEGRHLYVQTKDVTVSVVGTVFLVNAAPEGSRVAVLEGEVRVHQGTTEKTLLSGEQVVTNPLMVSPPVVEEISWSRNAESHLALLQQSAGSATSPTPQRPTEPQEAFEVASVRPSDPTGGRGARGGGGRNLVGDGCSGGPSQIDASRFVATNKTLYHLITMAYGTPGRGCGFFASTDLLSGGPGWIKSDQFDIEALMPEGSPSYTRQQLDNSDAPKLQMMIRTLLTNRFKLAMGREMKDVQVYVLTLVRGGPNLTPSKVEGRGSTGLGPRIQNGQVSVGLRSNKTTMEGLAGLLRLVTRAPVLDRTGLTGEFDINISFVPPDINSPLLPSTANNGLAVSGPSLFAALADLGLELTAAREKVEVLVVERAERPSEN